MDLLFSISTVFYIFSSPFQWYCLSVAFLFNDDLQLLLLPSLSKIFSVFTANNNLSLSLSKSFFTCFLFCFQGSSLFTVPTFTFKYLLYLLLLLSHIFSTFSCHFHFQRSTLAFKDLLCLQLSLSKIFSIYNLHFHFQFNSKIFSVCSCHFQRSSLVATVTFTFKDLLYLQLQLSL